LLSIFLNDVDYIAKEDGITTTRIGNWKNYLSSLKFKLNFII
jgi:hypothetical protein